MLPADFDSANWLIVAGLMCTHAGTTRTGPMRAAAIGYGVCMLVMLALPTHEAKMVSLTPYAVLDAVMVVLFLLATPAARSSKAPSSNSGGGIFPGRLVALAVTALGTVFAGLYLLATVRCQ